MGNYRIGKLYCSFCKREQYNSFRDINGIFVCIDCARSRKGEKFIKDLEESNR